MLKTFGNFVEMNGKPKYLRLDFPFTMLPIRDLWRNNGLSADFFADYWETFSRMYHNLSSDACQETRYAIRYIANELLENAMKFNYEPSKQPVTVGFYISNYELRFHVTNSMDPQNVGEFQHYIQQLLTADLEELYIRQLEQNVREKNNTVSRLGLLTILLDYQAQAAWKFQAIQQQPKTIMLTTMVQLKIEHFLPTERWCS